MTASNDAPVRVLRADYANPVHAGHLVALLDAYALDPMGGAHPLTEHAKQNLVPALAARPWQAFSVLAYADDGAGQGEGTPIGLVNCLEGFSTFACAPLVNVHDVVVLDGWRGRRVGEQMLALVEQLARERGACKLTLEVLQGNPRAIRLYERVGFANYQLGDANGNAMVLQKWLE